MEDFKKHFYGLDSLQVTKYRELAKMYRGQAMKALIAAFEWAAANIYRLAAMQHATGCDDFGITGMAEILRQVIDLDCQIIGTWLYAAYGQNSRGLGSGFRTRRGFTTEVQNAKRASIH